jgi:hypothetical protein
MTKIGDGINMNPFKKWLIATLILILLPLAALAGFNYYIDPLWNFDHANPYNGIQASFDERQQKTNYVTFNDFNYNALILGSSRTSYIDQNDFYGCKAYNYAVNNMLMEEYQGYVDYARQKKGSSFDYIFLGLDFFTTNRNLKLDNQFNPPAYYIGQANTRGYRYKTLLSIDACKFARQNYQASLRGVPVNYAYDRNNRKTLLKVDNATRDAQISSSLERYRSRIYADYEYRNVRKTMGALKDANPGTRFVVFTTPVSTPLFNLMTEMGLLPWYERWLTDLVEVFGEVYCFTYPNSITNNLDNYYDAGHFYPAIGTLVAHRVTGFPDPGLPSDFGILLNSETLPGFINELNHKYSRNP